MKVLTIKQPWASLIALGEKKIETRSWKTSYRGTLLIHAGKKIETSICKQDPFTEILYKHNIVLEQNMPVGAIIAKCELVDCLKIIGAVYENGIFKPKLSNGETVSIHNEWYFGDYTPGRYAWKLDNVKLLKKIISIKGKLSLWNYKEL